MTEPPPSVKVCLNELRTQSYFSEVPHTVAARKDAVIMGIDEAGRGPVLGPMVYAVSYYTRRYEEEVLVAKYEFDDSKKLTDAVRRRLFQSIVSGEIGEVGYATTAVSPSDISSGMLRYPPTKNYNLNAQAHDTTMALIAGVLDRGVQLEHVYVDTVGPPASYQTKLESRFPGVKFTVAKRADSTYCAASVASVVAKVTRDMVLELWEPEQSDSAPRPVGSGYPSDPRTTAFLHASQTPWNGWPSSLVRFSWQTCQTLLRKPERAVQLLWDEDYRVSSSSKTIINPPTDPHSTTAPPLTLDNWF